MEVEVEARHDGFCDPLSMDTAGRAGNLSPARWVSPTNPKLGPGWALIFLARKTGLNLARPDWPAGPNSIGSGWPGFFSGWPGLKN